jgi:hypothetical protein
MAITDQTILSQIQRVTLEGAGDLGVSWPSNQWTQVEVLGYLNQRQNRFRAETGLLWTRTETAITAGQSNQANPASWVTTVFLVYKSSAGVYRELPKLDAFELDCVLPSWPGASSATPRGYYEVDGETLTTFVVPIPTEVGSVLERYYVSMGTALTAAGVDFSVPDEFVPTIKYGALADMLSKMGEGQNQTLAAACEERWEEGLEFGKLVAQEGWFAL